MQNLFRTERDVALFLDMRIRLIISTVNVDEIVMLITVNLYFVRHQRI